MARNSSGTMSWAAGSGGPVTAGTTITKTWADATFADILAEITDSLSRSNKGGMLDVLKLVDGLVGGPGLSFNDEATSGLYRAGAGDVRLAILGALVAKFVATGLEVTGTVTASGGLANDATHGNLGGGALHADATGAADGFMPAADKSKLDAATDAATASTLIIRDADGRAKVADPSVASDIATKGYVDTSALSTVTITDGTGWTASTSSAQKFGGMVTVYLRSVADNTGGTAAWASAGTMPAGSIPAVTVHCGGYVVDSNTGLEYPARFQIAATTGVISVTAYDNGTSEVSLFTIGVNDSFTMYPVTYKAA